MTLATAIANKQHKFTGQCYVDGKPVKVTAGSIDYGYDSVSSAVSLTLQKLYSWIQFAKEVTCFLGWDGFTVQAARASLQIKQPDWFPLRNEIRASGYLSRAQKPYGGTLTYSSQTDTAIATDLLSKANVPYVDLDGAGTTLADVKDMVLTEDSTPWSMIEAVDRILGYKTFESAPDGVVRRRLITVGIPASSYAYTFEEGVNETHIRRVQGIDKVYNRIKITGLAGEGITTTRRADSPYVDRDYTFAYSSDWIQTQAISDALGVLLMTEHNRVRDDLEIITPLDPRVQPGQTCRCKNSSIGITSYTNYYIKHVNHSWGEGGAWSRLTVEGGTGEAGYQFAYPEAVFEFTVTKEKYDISGTPTVMYTIACDGSLSFDPDGSIASYAWENSANADTGTAVTYATAFTQAQMDAVPTITLTVTDNDGYTNALTLSVDQDVETIITRPLYVAASSRAEATADGGVDDWQTWTPGAGTVISTPQISAEDYGLFGLSDGKLMYTADYLATAPTEAHDFGSQINTIWVNEMDANRVCVGCDNGEIHATANMSDIASSSWTLLYTFGSAVNRIAESPYQFGQYWVCADLQVYVTFDSFGSIPALFSWDAGTARDIALSGFANYGCATVTGSDAPVKRSDGVEITGIVEADVRAITHHIRDDILYALTLDGDGTTLNSYIKAAGGTTFAALATVANAGQPNSMVRDGDNQLEHYLACNQGLYKTYDGFATIVRLRDYTGAGLDGLQVGYGSAQWIPITPLTVVSDTTTVVKNLWNGSGNDAEPSGWRDASYDDAAWGAAVEAYESGAVDKPTGSTAIWNDGVIIPASQPEICLFRKTFDISSGVVTSATLDVSNEDFCDGIWINNTFVYYDPYGYDDATEDPSHTVRSYTLDPQIFKPGETNVIAVKERQIDSLLTGVEYVAFRLVLT